MTEKKKQVIHCSAPSCQNNSLNCPELSFFPFPSREDEPQRCQQWLNNIQSKALCFNENKKDELHNKHRLCERHFTLDCFVAPSLRTELKPDVVPTIFVSASRHRPNSPKQKASRSSPPGASLKKKKMKSSDHMDPDIQKPEQKRRGRKPTAKISQQSQSIPVPNKTTEGKPQKKVRCVAQTSMEEAGAESAKGKVAVATQDEATPSKIEASLISKCDAVCHSVDNIALTNEKLKGKSLALSLQTEELERQLQKLKDAERSEREPALKVYNEYDKGYKETANVHSCRLRRLNQKLKKPRFLSPKGSGGSKLSSFLNFTETYFNEMEVSWLGTQLHGEQPLFGSNVQTERYRRFAISLYSMSKSAYQVCQQFFILPSIETVHKWRAAIKPELIHVSTDSKLEPEHKPDTCEDVKHSATNSSLLFTPECQGKFPKKKRGRKRKIDKEEAKDRVKNENFFGSDVNRMGNAHLKKGDQNLLSTSTDVSEVNDKELTTSEVRFKESVTDSCDENIHKLGKFGEESNDYSMLWL